MVTQSIRSTYVLRTLPWKISIVVLHIYHSFQFKTHSHLIYRSVCLFVCCTISIYLFFPRFIYFF